MAEINTHTELPGVPRDSPNTPIINELLCWVQNMITVLPENILIKLCIEKFEEIEISTALDIMLTLLASKCKVQKDLSIQESIPKSATQLKEIIKMFQEYDTSDLLKFVALHLNKLPNISNDSSNIIFSSRNSVLLNLSELERKVDFFYECAKYSKTSKHDLPNFVTLQLAKPNSQSRGLSDVGLNISFKEIDRKIDYLFECLNLLPSKAPSTFPCIVCGYTAESRDELDSHLSTHAGEQISKCFKCGFIPSGKELLSNHILTHSVKSMKSKKRASVNKKAKNSILDHAATYNGEKSKQSQVVLKSDFDHMLTHNGEKSNKSQVVLKTDLPHKVEKSNQSDVVNTLNQNELSNEFSSDSNVCDDNYVSDDNSICNDKDIGSDNNVDDDNNVCSNYVCDICGDKFQDKALFLKHNARHINTCTICKMSFSQKQNLNRHMHIHTGEKSFKCEICGMAFTHRQTFSCHLRAHTGEKPYSCSMCSRTFAVKGQLTIHMSVHREQKEYKCNICEKSFKFANSLKVHTRAHLGIPKAKCEICGKTFNQRVSLKSHMVTHTGVKDYKCTECGTLFARKDDLNKHIKRHIAKQTGCYKPAQATEKNHKCPECGKLFATKTGLMKHIKRHVAKGDGMLVQLN